MNAFDSAIPNHGPLLNLTQELVPNSTLPTIRGYDFYTTSFKSVGLQLTVDLHAVVGDVTYSVDFQQTYFLGTGAPYTPPTSSNITATVNRLPGISQSTSISLNTRAFVILVSCTFVHLFLGPIILF